MKSESARSRISTKILKYIDRVGDQGVRKIRVLYELGCKQQAVDELYRIIPDCVAPWSTLDEIIYAGGISSEIDFSEQTWRWDS